MQPTSPFPQKIIYPPIFILHHNFLNDVFNEAKTTKYREDSIILQDYLIILKALNDSDEQPAITTEEVFTRLCEVTETDPKALSPANIWKALEDYVKVDFLTSVIPTIKYEESVIVLATFLSQKGIDIVLVSNDEGQEEKIRIYYEMQGRPIKGELPFKVMNAKEVLELLSKLKKELHIRICEMISIDPISLKYK